MNKFIYQIVSAACVLVLPAVFLSRNGSVCCLFQTDNLPAVFILAGTAAAVHSVKAVRLYFSFYERHVKAAGFIRQYCKVVPAVMVLPFKSGDLLRAYCFGYQIHNYIAGCAAAIFDRFADTLALACVHFTVSLALGTSLSAVFYLLILFMLFLMLVYRAFPGMCAYWKRYFISIKATKNRLKILRLLEKADLAYQELAAVIRGKFLISFLLSVLAWAAELGGIVFAGSLGRQNKASFVSEYLTGALFGEKPMILIWFIFISAVLMMFLYVIMQFFSEKRRKIRHESCDGCI